MIGDIVRIVDWGRCYSSYDKFAKHHNVYVPLSKRSREDIVGEIIAEGPHLDNISRNLIIVRKENEIWIMEDNGVEIVASKSWVVGIEDISQSVIKAIIMMRGR